MTVLSLRRVAQARLTCSNTLHRTTVPPLSLYFHGLGCPADRPARQCRQTPMCPWRALCPTHISESPRAVARRTRQLLALAASSSEPYAPRYAPLMDDQSIGYLGRVRHRPAQGDGHRPLSSPAQLPQRRADAPAGAPLRTLQPYRATVATVPTQPACFESGRLLRAAHQVLLRHGERPIASKSRNR